jgi:aspartyl-tRNA(Asn)/glutamyl-tRNA(Gln) amidotransferase subunit A
MKQISQSTTQLIKLLRSKKVKESDIIKAFLERIDSVDDKICAFIFLNPHLREKQPVLESNGAGKLSGIPVGIKDNICVKDIPATCASKILENFKPPYDATVIRKLKAEGAVLVGKTNMDEFAFGSSCETSCYGPTKNPWDLSRIPGGSSGGSAAAVAADEVAFALGSDTGGSIRQPASMCGVVGLKPTYGRVSRYGLIAFASSLDQIGPITKTVEDAAYVMNIISGFDRLDSTSHKKQVPDFTSILTNDITGLKVGIPNEYFIEGVDAEVKEKVKDAIELLGDLGAEIKRITLPSTKYAVSTYYLITSAEASSNLARFDGVRYGRRSKAETMIDIYKQTRTDGFGEEAIRRIILGTYSLSSGYYEDYYLKAQKVRTIIRQEFASVFGEVDCIVTPTSPTPAFKIGEKINDPIKMYLSDILTIPANLAGIPAISIPCGFNNQGLPVGLQILARAFDEETLFKVAYAYQQNTQWHKQRPEL